jgi:hypothetical protein
MNGWRQSGSELKQQFKSLWLETSAIYKRKEQFQGSRLKLSLKANK